MDKKLYTVHYKYVTEGSFQMEAESIKEVKEEYLCSPNYGEYEKVISSKIVKIERSKLI